MTTTSRRKLNVPYEIERPDRIPTERYYDPEYFEMEKELIWNRTWQMAARLEYLQNPGDYVEYEIFDRSVIVVRTQSNEIKAFENTCRHRGVKLASGIGNLPSGFTCPFHGWCWDLDGNNTFLYQPDLFDEAQRDVEDVALVEVRCETGAGCAFINFDNDAPPLREVNSHFLDIADDWQLEGLRSEWWLSCALPTNWKLAMEAFMEGYHVAQTHPQLVSATQLERMGKDATYRDVRGTGTSTVARGMRPQTFTDSRSFMEAVLKGMRTNGEGMAGMNHENDLKIVEGLLDTLDLSGDPESAMQTFMWHVNEETMKWHRARGSEMPDLHEVMAKSLAPVDFCFPSYFVLPMFSSAASYRIRPITAETCLFELWSLTRMPNDEYPTPPPVPTPMPPDDARWPAIPAQDYSNLPIQQTALHNPGFKFMRLAETIEGLIGNYQRLIDGYMAGLSYEELVPATQRATGAFDVPLQDIGF